MEIRQMSGQIRQMIRQMSYLNNKNLLTCVKNIEL